MPSQIEERFDSNHLFRWIQITPENLIFGDKPDIRFTLNGKRIGLEHTRIDPQEYRRGTKLAQKHFPNLCYSPTGLHDDRDQRRSNDELIDTMLNDDEWEDVDESIKRWAESCAEALRTKILKMNHPDFDDFDENWLLISGQTGPESDIVSWHIAPRHLHDAISQTFNSSPDLKQLKQFDRVYFSFDPYLLLHTPCELKLIAPLLDTPKP